ncbi:hypothetical protein HPB50_018365 [Hyalomma asiaticum]|uniref:Uncharacterized protein n=1 Tax=Hyalomma asiaticum TaxID=266040 RepID=A0ACB7TLV7_HYAAI|nr:hypothetical protein HPB50_018365 [Hyalomma asiaticum]
MIVSSLSASFGSPERFLAPGADDVEGVGESPAPQSHHRSCGPGNRTIHSVPSGPPHSYERECHSACSRSNVFAKTFREAFGRTRPPRLLPPLERPDGT